MKFMAAILRLKGMDGRLWREYTSVVVSGQCLRERIERRILTIVRNRGFDVFLRQHKIHIGEGNRSG